MNPWHDSCLALLLPSTSRGWWDGVCVAPHKLGVFRAFPCREQMESPGPEDSRDSLVRKVTKDPEVSPGPPALWACR